MYALCGQHKFQHVVFLLKIDFDKAFPVLPGSFVCRLMGDAGTRAC
jgi:hypothetical protein